MTIDLTGRTALVTGGNVGIGAGIAKKLGACGAAVAITYYSHADEARQTLQQMRQQGCRAEMFQLDATDSGQVEAVVTAAAEYLGGKIDILVNNAGHLIGRVNIDEMSDVHWHRVIDVNLSARFTARGRF